MRAPRHDRAATSRASATPLGHSSAQYGIRSSRSKASSSISASASRGRRTGELAVAQRDDLLDEVHDAQSYAA